MARGAAGREGAAGDRCPDHAPSSRLARLLQVRGRGVLELKIDVGPGYRVYFGQAATRLVVLLCGGDKRRQTADIRIARERWRDYMARRYGTKC